MKRTLALLLSALLLAVTLAACADDAPQNTDTTVAPAAESTAAPVETTYDPLPVDTRYDGQTLRVLARDHTWVKDEITVDEMNGEVVNDAVFRREEMLRDRLGVSIEKTFAQGADELENATYTKTLILSQTDAYDVISSAVYSTIPLTVEGLYLNLLDIPNLDLTQAWWAQGFNAEMSVGRAQYLACGDLTLSLKRFTFVTVFNKQIFLDHGIGDEIYQTVRDFKWTIEYQTALAADMYRDLNGNNASDVNDRFGFICGKFNISADPYWSSFDIPILSKDAENWYTYGVNVERLDRGVGLINKLWWSDFSYPYPFETGDSEQDTIADKFAAGQAAMTQLRLLNIENESVRNMTDAYGILPVPLLEDTQTAYYSMAHDQFGVVGLPLTVPAERHEMIGAALTYLAFTSREVVSPAYYEVALKTKYADDPQSGEMLDIIFDGFRIDAGVLYSSNLTAGVGPHQNLRNFAGNNSNAVASTFKTVDKMTPKPLDRLQEKLAAIQS